MRELESHLPAPLALFERHARALALGSAALLAVLIVLHPYTMPMRYPLFNLVDLQTYRDGGRAILAGEPLYDSTSGIYHLNFVYTPFAALAFVPLAWFPAWLTDALAPYAQLAVLVWIVWMGLRSLGHPDTGALRRATLGITSVLLWLEPVFQTICLGQINLVLLLLLVWDTCAPRPARSLRWQGIAVGVAAGIKLTPGIFIVYLAATRRLRAAALACAAFAGTAVLGFLAAPHDSWTWWGGTFARGTRIGEYAICVNQSWSGLVARLLHAEHLLQWTWVLGAAAIASLGLWMAVMAHRDGHTLLGATLCGMTGTMVSPFSWSHHWVWFAPLALVALHHARAFSARARTLAVAAFAVCLLAWPVGFVTGRHEPDMFGLFAIAPWHGLDVVYHNVFILVYAAVAVAAIRFLRRTDVGLVECRT
ncbi:glycosyltransferase 87 family protein [Pendulispora albinea]|uniref:Glycosyltransferase 87 family protein n=1 Tax=Pendulispora albinea TaxID=2741071 RepID=A0ABZ2M4J1_9BACT